MTHDYGDNCTDILPRGRGWGGLYVNTHTQKISINDYHTTTAKIKIKRMPVSLYPTNMTNLEVPRNICPSQNPSCSRKEDRKDGGKSLLSPEVRPEVVLKGVCCNTRQQTIQFLNKPRHGTPRRRSSTLSTP